MLYFSELKNKKVYTEDNIRIGKLKDLIFLASENPVVTKLVMKTPNEPNVIIPLEYIKKLDGAVVLSKNYETSELDENEL